MVSRPCLGVLLVEAKIKVVQPLDLLLGVVCSLLLGDDVLDHDTAILVELVPPVVVDLVLVERHQIFGLDFGGVVRPYPGRRRPCSTVDVQFHEVIARSATGYVLARVIPRCREA